MLPSHMNLRIGKIKTYNNKILVSSSSFNIGTDLKINLDADKHIEKDKPDIKSIKEDKQDIKIFKTKPHIKSNREHKQDIKMVKAKPEIKSRKEDKHNIKMIKTKPDMNEITYEEEKAALILGIIAIFTVWWMFK